MNRTEASGRKEVGANGKTKPSAGARVFSGEFSPVTSLAMRDHCSSAAGPRIPCFRIARIVKMRVLVRPILRLLSSPTTCGRRRISWRKVAVVLFAAIAAAYATGALSIFYWLRFHRGISRVDLGDVALPGRWPLLKRDLGYYATDLGLAHLASGRARESLAYLNAGLRRFPQHRDGRVALAELQAALGDSAGAVDLLLAGVCFHASDPDYVAGALGLLRRLDDEASSLMLSAAAAVRIAGFETSLRAQAAGSLVVVSASESMRELARYDDAEVFLNSFPHVAGSTEGRLLRTRIAWDRGETALALVLLREWTQQSGYAPLLARELVFRLQQSGLGDEARRQAMVFKLAHPTDFSARLLLLAAYGENADIRRLAEEFESLLDDFRDDRAALFQAAEFAARNGWVDYVQAVAGHSRKQGIPTTPLDLLHCEALLVSRRYSEALTALSAWETNSARTPPRDRSAESLRATAYLGMGDRAAARAAFKPLLDSRQVSSRHLEILAGRFSALGAAEEAWLLLDHAQRIGPPRISVLSRLVELGIELNRVEALPDHLAALAALPKSSSDLLRVAHHKLGSDLFLFSRTRGRALQSVSSRLGYSGESPVPGRQDPDRFPGKQAASSASNRSF